jgi:hypothetical protein
MDSMRPNLLAFLVLAMGVTPLCAASAQPGSDAQRPAAEQPARPAPRPVAPVTIKQLRDNVYAALGGAGGVSGVVVGDKGVIVIDAKQTPDSASQTIARIGEITPKPVTTIILTGNGGEGIPGLAGKAGGPKCPQPGARRQDAERHHQGRPHAAHP